MISEFDEESLTQLNEKADLYLNTFFPKNKILEKFKKFYKSKSDNV